MTAGVLLRFILVLSITPDVFGLGAAVYLRELQILEDNAEFNSAPTYMTCHGRLAQQNSLGVILPFRRYEFGPEEILTTYLDQEECIVCDLNNPSRPRKDFYGLMQLCADRFVEGSFTVLGNGFHACFECISCVVSFKESAQGSLASFDISVTYEQITVVEDLEESFTVLEPHYQEKKGHSWKLIVPIGAVCLAVLALMSAGITKYYRNVKERRSVSAAFEFSGLESASAPTEVDRHLL